jgi:hypothetical protein
MATKEEKENDSMSQESGMIGDKEVVLHKTAKFTWAIDIIKHTSDDTNELVEGWVVGDEYKAFALYYEKVSELKQYDYPNHFQYPEETWGSVNLEGLLYDCNFYTEDGNKYITFYQCFKDNDGENDYINTDTLDDFATYE